MSFDTSNISSYASNRSIVVEGDPDAVFSLQVYRASDTTFYNFETRLFGTAVTSKSRLKNQKPGSFPIAFPTNGSGDTYSIYIWPEPHFNTELAFGKNKLRYESRVRQSSADGTLTILTDGSITNYSSQTIGTLKGVATTTYTSTTGPTIPLNIDRFLTSVAHSSNHGVKITDPESEESWDKGTWGTDYLYWQTTAADYETTSGSDHDTGATSTALVLNSVTGLYIGMHVSVIESGSVTATMPTITDINENTLTVTLSAAQTWASGKDITFRAYDSSLIKQASGIGIYPTNDFTVKLAPDSTKLRTAITGNQTTANVIGTVGISKDALVRCTFIEKDNDTENACKVSAVTGHVTEGVIAIANGTFTSKGAEVGSVIYIDVFSSFVSLGGNIVITKFPRSNHNIYIDISKILTAGTAS